MKYLFLILIITLITCAHTYKQVNSNNRVTLLEQLDILDKTFGDRGNMEYALHLTRDEAVDIYIFECYERYLLCEDPFDLQDTLIYKLGLEP